MMNPQSWNKSKPDPNPLLMSHLPIVVFAQIPPPEHGQSRMVQRTLDALRSAPDDFKVHHVNARFSNTLEDVGESSLGKLFLTFKYLVQAIRMRSGLRSPVLLYVPGPANWSPVLRDWLLLAALRIFYPRVAFHWHAIGHGEWAHGSKRLTLEGPAWLDRCARAVSRRLLEEPFASISVSETSRKDAAAVASLHNLVVPNGIEDPCADFEESVEPVRNATLRDLKDSVRPCFRILFLSHGTLEKGILDAVLAIRQLLETCDPRWRFAVTFAGGLSEDAVIRFEKEVEELERFGGDRITIRLLGYVSGDEKRRCYLEHDIFLSPSRWESFGLTVLEAMAFGMRIVAAASDGVQGVLPPGYPYLAPVASPADLAESLRACCSDLHGATDNRMGLVLRQRFLTHYQLKDFSNNLIEAFRKLGGENYGESAQPSPDSSRATAGERRPMADAAAYISLPTYHGPDDSRINLFVYLADQNPGHDRSFGISRMTQTVLAALLKTGKVSLETISSRTSQQGPREAHANHVLPWGTRRKWMRLLTDHLHPLFVRPEADGTVFYFPKGYLPWWHSFRRPSVVTIHDTIIQYDEDHYPAWRKSREYAYWARMLKHTLSHADHIMTVSQSSRRQIEDFMHRHGIPRNDITVTYEPCIHEQISQPENPAKENYVIHLASCEPHKRSSHLIRWWHLAEQKGHRLPTLHLIGSVPPEVEPLLASARTIVKRPFLDDPALQAAYLHARALILPSEIEGFGLPALEAYYLGTPVCFVRETSVEEVLSVATDKGGFSLESLDSLFSALETVMQMSPEEVRACGLKLRETYAAEKVAGRMLSVFHECAERHHS
jgi:glycosyltransferase involved in cell wall biosynthesis